MNNFERLKSMSVEELAEWLDKNGSFDDSPWLNAFNEKYCAKCGSIECNYADAKEKLGITPFYDDTIECAYCEIYNKCRYFEDMNDVPDNREMIKMWLESEVEDEEV
jgi:hypothetical protein